MKTTIGLYKTKCIRTRVFNPGPYKTLADVEYATAGWADWSNSRRLHSAIGLFGHLVGSVSVRVFPAVFISRFRLLASGRRR